MINTRLRQIGLPIAYNTGLYILILIFRPIYIYLIVQGFANRKYIDDFSMRGQLFDYLLLLAYCLFSYHEAKKTSLLMNNAGLLYWLDKTVILTP